MSSLQTGLSLRIRRPFCEIRNKTVYETTGKDQPFGHYFLSDKEEKEKFMEFCDSFSSKFKVFASRPLKQCTDVMTGLYNGQCLFSKTGGFHILHAKPPCVQFGETLTVIFDATAKVDGDYQFLSNVCFLGRVE